MTAFPRMRGLLATNIYSRSPSQLRSIRGSVQSEARQARAMSEMARSMIASPIRMGALVTVPTDW